METVFEETEIAKNQISIDFDNIAQLDDQEESSALSQTFSQEEFENLVNDVLLVVVKNKSGSKVGWYNSFICGRPLVDWVAMAGGGCEKRLIDDNDNIVETLKLIKTQKQYMLVLYSDTPLMSKDVVYKIVDYFVRNRLNVMTLLRGYMVKVEFLKNIDMFSSTTLEKFDEKAFMQVNDGLTYNYASSVIRQKILDFHEKNGVIFEDKNLVAVDADVEIDSGVLVKRNNILKGQSVVGKNTVLQEGNVIVNSIIGEDCDLLGCKLYESKIGQGQQICCQNFFCQNVDGKA